MALVGSCSETESLKGFGARHRALGRKWQSEGGWQLVEEKQQREGSMVNKTKESRQVREVILGKLPKYIFLNKDQILFNKDKIYLGGRCLFREHTI